MFLILDIGNTRAKLAVFEEGSLKRLEVVLTPKIFEKIFDFFSEFNITHSIVSSVAGFSADEVARLKELLNPIFLDAETPVPFHNAYGTPKTLGVDRIALAAAAVQQYPGKNVLVIDAGTCITYDFIDANKNYLGGAIAPGIRMRYRSLSEFTAKLPLLETYAPDDFIGTDTATSMHVGVVNGVYNEIKGLVNQYKARYQHLTVVLTGGDTKFLSEQFKNGIFAHPNFVLEGLHTILIFNIAND